MSEGHFTLDDQGKAVVLARVWDSQAHWLIVREANQWASVPVPILGAWEGLYDMRFSSTLGVVAFVADASVNTIRVFSSKTSGAWTESTLQSKYKFPFSVTTFVATDPAGRLHVVYERKETDKSTTLAYASIAEPNEWSSEVLVPLPEPKPAGTTEHDVYRPSVFVTPAGEARVIFKDNVAGDVVLVSRQDKGVFQPPVSVAPETQQAVAATTDAHGREHFLMVTGGKDAPVRVLAQDCAH